MSDERKTVRVQIIDLPASVADLGPIDGRATANPIFLLQVRRPAFTHDGAVR
jgi:hypothetical protein